MSEVFASVKVEGLSQFRRSLKELDKDIPKALRVAFNDIITIVVDDARPKVPRRTGAAAASIKVASTQGAARIKAGGAKAPYFPWLDFGGKRKGRGGGIAERKFLKSGRFIWHSFAAHRADIVKSTEEAVAAIARQAGLEVTHG